MATKKTPKFTIGETIIEEYGGSLYKVVAITELPNAIKISEKHNPGALSLVDWLTEFKETDLFYVIELIEENEEDEECFLEVGDYTIMSMKCNDDLMSLIKIKKGTNIKDWRLENL
jgi:hypothetical protein